jgi:cell shape-determining protein MreC
VETVEHDPGNAFAKVIATPLAHLDRSREVLLVWPNVAVIEEIAENIPVEEIITTTETTDSSETAADNVDTDSSNETAIESAADIP